MKFFTILFAVLFVARVIIECFVGYAPFIGKLATSLTWLTIGAGILMVVFIGIKIFKDITGKK